MLLKSILVSMLLISVAVYFTPPAPLPPPDLSAEEVEYIKNNVVMVAVEENYHPFISSNESLSPAGISVDYLNLISKKTGLVFSFQNNPCQLEACLDSVREGENHLVTSVRPTPLRSEFLSFSRPYYFVGTVIIKVKKFPKLTGVGQGFAVNEFLKLYYKSLNLVEFKSDEDALIALMADTIDSVVMDERSASVLRKKYNHSFDEQIIPHDYPLSFAVGKHNRVLVSILDKALSSITDQEKLIIEAKWK